jgi:subtilisin family serine protease
MDPALLEALRWHHPDDELEAIIRLRPGVTMPPAVRPVAAFGTIFTCRLRARHVVEVHDRPEVVSLKAPRLLESGTAIDDEGDGLPSLEDRLRPPRLPGVGRWTGRGVLVAVLDWGLDFTADSLRNPDGTTRIRALWDQRGPGSAGNHYGYGRILDRQAIDSALASGQPEEVLCYRAADADPTGRGAHGTHVADIAAGNGRTPETIPGVAPEADLCFVHLSSGEGQGLSDLGDSVRLLEALDFVRATAGGQPWVVNMSLGRTGGEHTGSSLVERAIDLLLEEAPGRLVVISGGNYFERQTHAEGQVRPGRPETLRWVVPEDDPTPNELEVWYRGVDRLSLLVSSPGGAMPVEVPLGQHRELVVGGRSVGRAYHRAADPNNHDHHIDVFLDARAPGGTWSLELRPRDVADGRYHAWIERDSLRYQSRFDAAQASPRSTMGTLASGHRALAVGACNSWLPGQPIASFSSSGPDRYGRFRPDLVAPGEGIAALRSSPLDRPTGWRRVVSMSGSSMAAPHVAGAAAALFQAAGRPLPISVTRALILGTCRESPVDDPLRSGCGHLDVAAALAELERTITLAQTEDSPMPTPDSQLDADATLVAPAFDGGAAEVEPALPPRTPHLDPGQVAIHVRSYAPFRQFGGGFSGDGRGHSTSASATSRVSYYVVLDLRAGREVTSAVWSDLSHSPWGTSARGRPRAFSRSNFSERQASAAVHLSGSNPLVPGAPDIDLAAQVSLAWTDDTLTVSCRLTGDGFPNAEVFVEDFAGRRVFVTAYATRSGGSATDVPLLLAGDPQRPMGAGAVTLRTDRTWRFDSVLRGNGVSVGILPQPTSIADWNALFEGRGSAAEMAEEWPAAPLGPAQARVVSAGLQEAAAYFESMAGP